jgi:hypothetical protein
MASVNKLLLYSGAISGDTVGTSYSLGLLDTDFSGYLDLTALSATNVVVKIQRSPDNIIWFDWITFSTATGTGSQLVDASTNGMSYARANFDFTGGAQTGTATVSLHYDKKSK